MIEREAQLTRPTNERQDAEMIGVKRTIAH
jgi:hypothetical protein